MRVLALRRGIALILAVIGLDQISKWWIMEQVMRPEGVVETPFYGLPAIEITSFFNIVMVWNRGISFGFFSSLPAEYRPWILAGFSLLIVTILFYWLVRATGCLQIMSFSLIIGGALGNVIDRVRFGAVADFLDVHVAGYHWPAFNIADSAITVGAVLLFVETLFFRRSAS